MITRQRKKRSKKRGKNYYFTIDHENAIIQYSNTDCIKERTRLYIDFIQPAFSEMVDKIVFTYKFTNLPNCDSLRDECKIWLMTILGKYDPSKGSAAFSSYLTYREEEEFWKSFYKELGSWDVSQMKENDIKVYKAINILFESKEDIEIFNKKAIYLYLREITGLNTKQIVNSLKKFRKKYSNFKQGWENTEL